MAAKIGLVLSGGGVKAIAHVGFLKVLLENNIKPTHIAGTSAGAMVAAFYAKGYDLDTILTFFKTTPLLKLSMYTRAKPGFMDSEKFVSFFEKYFPEDDFKTLILPVTVAATNLTSGQLDFFNSGQLIRPLIASCAIPPVFSPVEINNNLYCDGGILNNFPVEPLENHCDVILGSFVNPVAPIQNSDITSSIKLLYRAYHIGMDFNDIEKFKNCDYVFAPSEVKTIGALDTKAIDKAFEMGYKFAKAQEAKILKAINKTIK
ncbi:MAG: phospholipase [Bacteroidetes bacterium MedPE-SWsnd-G2]|nr:MAG: phospholipase [Bacteroidetes bacterium MedPE-SWsnd-G2]